MAGHSKWANIKHKKARMDAQRGKVFTKIAREIIVAARQGGGDPEGNARLKAVIQKARENNMPNDNIMRAIQRGTGEIDGANYEEMVYEGYGPGGIAVLMNITTDNRNRTAGEIRHIFSKNGGNLGESGCVNWMFDRKGLIALEVTEADEEQIMMDALESGADDVEVADDVAQVTVAPEDLEQVKVGLIEAGYKVISAEVSMVPQNSIAISDVDTAKKLIKLMDALEDHDDVQDAFANFDIPEEILEQI
ncbi:MAG: YebC/PmpR family DNA-binding transcriptional regulator [Bacillota bacterium]|nr:YebC/PmpR family DNA-binding transcriptional regulator [Bacillota bacterium]